MSAETHVTDSELELDPYIIMDYVDGDERRNVRFGDVWLPYRRVESYVVLALTPCQDETLRVPSEASADFDLRTLRDDDIVRINYRLYTGFDIKRVIAEDLENSETLLGSGAIAPHECPEPAASTTETAKKLSFWEREQAAWAVLVALFSAFFTSVEASIMFSDYLSSLYLGYPSVAAAIFVEFGILSLAWLAVQHMAGKRDYYSDKSTPIAWKLTAFCCVTSVVNVGLMLYAIAKQS